MKTLKPAILPLLLMAILSVSWYFTPPPYLVVTAPPAGRMEYKMVMEPPAMNPQKPGQANLPNRLVFWNTGDGRYLLANVDSSTLKQYYTYRSSGSFMPYVESTEVYTDKQPPKTVARMTTETNQTTTDPNNVPTGNPAFPISIPIENVSSQDPFKLSLLAPVQIIPTRRLVPESFVTYAVTLENIRSGATFCGANGGSVKLTYDADVLAYQQTKDYYTGGSENSVIVAGANGGSKGVVTIGFGDLIPLEQRSYFFVFKTKAGVTVNTPVDELTKVELSFTAPCNGPFNATVFEHNQVFDSHDPNHKIILPDTFCPVGNRDMKFRVDFQNDGPGPTETIEIEDELDFLFLTELSPMDIKEVKAYIGGEFHSTPTLVFLPTGLNGAHKIKFTLNNAVLNGTNQPGYSTLFSDVSTKGFLEFKINTNLLSAKPRCNAVCNKARIFFDCNAPIETNTALSRINCIDCSACIDTFFTLAPGFLESTTRIPLIPDNIAGDALKDSLEKWLGVGYYFKWYPVSKVHDPQSIDANSETSEATTYTLVASSAQSSAACRRVVIQRVVKPYCSFKVIASATLTDSTGCPENWKYRIDAHVMYLTNGNNLVWNNLEPGIGACQQGGLTWSAQNVPSGRFQVSVMNKVTGCFAETWVDTRPVPLSVDDNPNDCDANLMVSGGTPPYSYQWQWAGKVQPYNSNYLTGLAGKQNLIVTVTDAKGCKKVFRPKSNCPSNIPPLPGWGLISLLGAGAAGAAYWMFRKKSNQPSQPS